MSKRTAITVSALLLGAVGASGSADALILTQVHHGALCNSKTSTDGLWISYDQFGARNDSQSQSSAVSCGSLLLEDAMEFGIRARAYDRHPTQDVCCNARFNDRDSGDTVASVSACTSGFDSAYKSLDFSLPTTLVAVAHVECTLPPLTNNGHSYISALFY